MLESQIYARALYLCKYISDDVVTSEDEADALVNALFKRDHLEVVSEAYHDFTALLAMKRGSDENFHNFESRFSAYVCKCSAQSDDAKLPEVLTAFILIANSNVDNSQRNYILAASAPREDTFSRSSTTTEFIKKGFLRVNCLSYSSMGNKSDTFCTRLLPMYLLLRENVGLLPKLKLRRIVASVSGLDAGSSVIGIKTITSMHPLCLGEIF